MPRPRKNALDIDDSLDYQQLYTEAAGTIQALQKDLEVANKQVQILQEDYNDALEKNQEMASRIHQMESRLEALEEMTDTEIEVKDGYVTVSLPEHGAEIKTVLGPKGTVRRVREVCINGIVAEYECGHKVSMPVEHAMVLGAL